MTDAFFCNIITMLYNSVIRIWGKDRVIDMGGRDNSTAAAILEAGKKEFLTYGYEKASLRRIAKEASVTTGAIYGYFPGKKALFDALTADTAEELLAMYDKVHKEFASLPPGLQPARLNEITEQYIPWMVNYIYDHFEVFKLLLCCSAPGVRERYFDRLAAVEEQSCWDFINAMESLGHTAAGMSSTLIHILCRSFFQQLHEFVSHGLPREQAVSCSLILSRFQHAGWVRIMGLDV